jgi:hypothetical protein
MYTNQLALVKGFIPGAAWVVDKVRGIASGETASNFVAGRGVYQDPTTGNWKIGGSGLTATTMQFPWILYKGYADFDVAGDDGNFLGATAGANASTGGTWSPSLTAVSLAMGLEVETTEYDAGSYPSGTMLVFGTDGKIEVVAGSGAKTICGVVTDGIKVSEHSRTINLLRFHGLVVPRFA